MGSRGQAVRETLAHPTLTWGFWPEVIQAGHLVVELAVELAHGKFLYPTLFVSEVLYFRVLTWCGWVGTGNMALPSGIPCFGGWDPHFFGVHLLDPSQSKPNWNYFPLLLGWLGILVLLVCLYLYICKIGPT